MSRRIIGAVMIAVLLLGMTGCNLQGADSNEQEVQEPEEFRVALSLSQGVEENFEKGITYTDGKTVATNPKELQELYNNKGATEMYVRVATKRYADGDDGGDSYHARIHNLESCLKTCEIASELGMPINPEIMCAYTYMDGFEQQAPDFCDYPEIEKPDKPWSEYELEEMCDVLEQYGELVAQEILDTGCEVEYWNIGNEANFGFAGVNLGLETAVNPELIKKTSWDMYSLRDNGISYLKKNVWNYNGQLMSALASGIKKADPDAQFATHIAALFGEEFAVSYFQTIMENGMHLDQAGISIYPTNTMSQFHPDYMGEMKDSILGIEQQCGLPVFIAEYGYPSEKMTGTYVAWSNAPKGYSLCAEDQAEYTMEFISWCKENGVSGIRPWGPDIMGDWEPMSFFEYDEKTMTATAKPVMEVFMQSQ